jgi:hypothetical protein
MLGLVVALSVVAYAAATLWRSPPGSHSGLDFVPGGTDRPLQAQTAPRTDRRTSVHALARLEPAGGLIVGGARPGIRIERVLVAAGDLVQASQPLAILEGQAEARRPARAGRGPEGRGPPPEGPEAQPDRRRALPEVTAARPLFARMHFWRCPSYPPATDRDPALEGGGESSSPNALARWWQGARRPRPLQRRALLVLGIDPDRNPFRDPIRSQIAAAGSRLREADRVLFNDRSNPDFGWDQWPRFTGWELGNRRVDVIGPFSLTRSFGADASVLCTDTNFARTFGLPSLDGAVNFGLVTLRPGSAPEECAARLARALPPDVKALSRRALYRLESDY